MTIKEKISKKHIIIGTSALVLIAGGITVGVIANNSDEQPANAPIVETQPTTEQVTTTATTATTKATTTTTAATTTTAKTTNKPKKTEKKEDSKSDNKTEVKDDNNTSYEDDNNYEYDESQYEEPVNQETPKQDTPAPESDYEEPEDSYEEEPNTPDFAPGTILSYNPYCDYCYEVTIDPDHYITGHSANIFGEISESGLQNALYTVRDYYSGVEITETITCYVYIGY